MTIELEKNYHSHQIERYLSQVIRAFSGFSVSDGVVRDGEVHTERVPVIFGSPSRVVAALVSNRSEFQNVKLPIMGVNLMSLDMDEERTLSRFHENELTHRRVNGEVQNFERITGVPLSMSISLGIYASSISQLMELLEAILLTFNPEVTIQKSTDVYDADYITAIRLTGISNEITSPLGEQTRSAQMTLQFSVPIRLSYEHRIKEAVDEVVVRVKDEKGTFAEDEIISVLDQHEEI